VVKCFKYREKGHKCRECPLQEKRERVVCTASLQKAYQHERRPARPIKKKAQEEERQLRRVEEEKAACSVQKEAQQAYRRTTVENLRKRAEEYYRKDVPAETQLLELK